MTQQPTKKAKKPGYKTLEFNVSKFLPPLYVFYNYHQILKHHHFIQDVSLVHQDNRMLLRVERFHPKSP